MQLLESVVQSAAYLAPEGERADLLLEAASALLGVVGVVNSVLLPCDPHAPPPRSTLAACVAVIHQVETLVEMGAERGLGAQGKWSLLAAVEALKAALRLAILRRSGAHILLHDAAASGALTAFPGSTSSAAERTGRTLRALATFRAARARSAGYPLAAALPVPPSLPAQLQRLRVTLLAAESLRILRPLAYCLAAGRYGRASWRPWLLSLSMDLASGTLLQRLPQNREEQEELHRRRTLLVYYLLSSPAYGAGVQPVLRACERAAAPLPFFGVLLEKMRETVDGVSHFHSLTTSL